MLVKCEKCGNLAYMTENRPMMCCEKTMVRIIHNMGGASIEKHMPAVQVDKGTVTVQVGEAVHPMARDHFISWIVLAQGEKTQCLELKPDDKPIAVFTLDTDRKSGFSVYAYCNQHGLWKKNVDN